MERKNLGKDLAKSPGLERQRREATMNQFDQDLIRTYVALSLSVDCIAGLTEVRTKFLANPPLEVRMESDDVLIWRIVQLRKNRNFRTHSSGN